MKYYTDGSTVLRFIDDNDAKANVDLNVYRSMTDNEIDRFENPESYLSDEEKLKLMRSRMPVLSPIQFDLRLRKAGLLQTVRNYVASNEVMEIAYTRATYFSRTDPFIETARQALELTDDQVDNIWTSGP